MKSSQLQESRYVPSNRSSRMPTITFEFCYGIPLILNPNGPLRLCFRIFLQPFRPRIFAFPYRSRIRRRWPRNTARSLSQHFRTRRHVPLWRICKVPPLAGTYLHRPLRWIPNCFPRSVTLLNLPRYFTFHLPRLLLTFLHRPPYLSRILGYTLFRLNLLHFCPNRTLGRPRRKRIGLPLRLIFTIRRPLLGYIQRALRRIITFKRRMTRRTGRQGFLSRRMLTRPLRILRIECKNKKNSKAKFKNFVAEKKNKKLGLTYWTRLYLSINYSKNPQIRSYWFKNLQAEIWHLNTQKYKNLFSMAKKNSFLYQKITPILMVKILDFNCVRNFWQKVIVIDRLMKTSSIAVETSRSTSQSDSIVRQTNKRSFPKLLCICFLWFTFVLGGGGIFNRNVLCFP